MVAGGDVPVHKRIMAGILYLLYGLHVRSFRTRLSRADTDHLRRSRLIRLELSHTSPTPTIHAIQLVPYNDLNYPHALPSGAVLSQLRGSYRLFRGPDSGFSHSLLHPQLNFVDLFNIDQSTGALLGPSAQSIRISSARLKLRLERVERVIGEERVERMDDARGMARTGMMALLMGRLSPKEWPTKHLLGTERGGKQIGALRGVSDWISGRGEERELVEKEGITVVEGFKLQIRRKIIQLPGAFPGPARAAMGERRRGVGADGGPAVLWHGEERDPDGGAGVAIVRAGGGATGSEVRLLLGLFPCSRTNGGLLQELVFHLPTGEEEEDIGEELVPGSRSYFVCSQIWRDGLTRADRHQRGILPSPTSSSTPLLQLSSLRGLFWRDTRSEPRRSLASRRSRSARSPANLALAGLGPTDPTASNSATSLSSSNASSRIPR